MAQNQHTFRELLDENRISFEDFYESCLNVEGQDLWVLYSDNLATKSGLEKIVQHLNSMTGKEYTPEDIFTVHVYG